MNSYKVSTKTQTTGWDATKNDINGVNSFNMTPIQVAAQAGQLDDMRAILNHPQFDPKTAKNMGVYFEICRQDNPVRYKKIGDMFREALKYDNETQQWSRKSPMDDALSDMTLAEKIDYNRKKMGLTPDTPVVAPSISSTSSLQKPAAPNPFKKN